MRQAAMTMALSPPSSQVSLSLVSPGSLTGLYTSGGLFGYPPPPPLLFAGNIGAVIGLSSLHFLTPGAADAIRLVDEGCQVPDANGHSYAWARTYNCSRACADPDLLFASPFTPWNCATLAAVSLLVGDGYVTIDPASVALVNGQLGAGISPDGTSFDTDLFNASAVVASLAGCAAAGCQGGGFGTCDAEVSSYIENLTSPAAEDFGGFPVVKDLLWAFTGYCDRVDTKSSASQVAGPGIVVGLIVQALVASLGFILLKLLTSWARLLAFPFVFCLKRAWGDHPKIWGCQDPPTPWAWVSRMQFRLARTPPTSALLLTMAEFHDIHAYFVIAIETAALIANTAVAAPPLQSFAAAVIESELVTILATASFVPVLLVELLLRRYHWRYYLQGRGRGANSWYTLLLSTASWVLACAVLATAPIVDVGTISRRLKAEAPLPQCGGNPGLMASCGLNDLPNYNLIVPLIFAVGLGYPTIPALWIEQIAWAISSRGEKTRLLAGGEPQKEYYDSGIAARLGRSLPPVWRRCWIGAVEAVWYIIQGGFVVYMVLYLIGLFSLLPSLELGASQWTAGQVVAVAIWVPVLIRYLHYNISGVKHGVEARLPSDYEAVRRKTAEVEVASGEGDPLAIDLVDEDFDEYSPRDGSFLKGFWRRS